jgi:hypothetical protein
MESDRSSHRRSAFPPRALVALAAAATTILVSARAQADAVTDWNEYTVAASKGFNGVAGAGVTIDTNLSTRLEAIEGRAVFDAINAIDHFVPAGYHYNTPGSGSAAAAAAQAAHDVILAILPDPAAETAADARWAQPRAWVDAQLAAYLAALGVAATDPGLAAGQAAAAAAVAARRLDNSSPVVAYGAALVAASNPGVGLWRQSNAAPGALSALTGAPTGFDATGAIIQGRAAIDLNWRDLTPFSLTTRERTQIVAAVPAAMVVGSLEYLREVEYVRQHGQDVASPSARSADQTAQALFYRQDAEIFVNEAARIASRARGLELDDNAKLFALLGNVMADARVAAWASKFEQKFWRPITAINANPDGSVTNNYAAWHPLATTPPHPSNTAGHSTTGAAGFELLRAFFGDAITPDGLPVTLGTLPWLVGTNNGTGNATTRTVSSFSQAQLENGASRLYLGIHYGFDNLQGQLTGLAVADRIIRSRDPAASGLRVRSSHVSLRHLTRTLLSRPELYGLFSAPENGFNDIDDEGRDFLHH